MVVMLMKWIGLMRLLVLWESLRSHSMGDILPGLTSNLIPFWKGQNDSSHLPLGQSNTLEPQQRLQSWRPRIIFWPSVGSRFLCCCSGLFYNLASSWQQLLFFVLVDCGCFCNLPPSWQLYFFYSCCFGLFLIWPPVGSFFLFLLLGVVFIIWLLINSLFCCVIVAFFEKKISSQLQACFDVLLLLWGRF